MYKLKQSGAALLIIVTFIVLAAVTLFLTKLNDSNFQIEDGEQTARALRQAKEALIGFAATYAKTHPGQPEGYLPCPDHDGDGSSSTCGNAGHSVIGRFPWRTLGLPPLRDGAGECLWYAVSGSYKDNPKLTLTSDTDGAFIIENASGNVIAGSSARSRAIAVIFSPSVPLSGQTRNPSNTTECGDNVQVIDYLDSLSNIDNATGDRDVADGSNDDIFQDRPTVSANFWVTSDPADTPTFINASKIKAGGNTGQVIFNDTLVWITPTDFKSVYERMDFWVAEKVTGCLEEYVANDNYREHFLKIAYDSSGNGGFLEAIGDKDNPEDDTYRKEISDSVGDDEEESEENCKDECNEEGKECQENCPSGSEYAGCVATCQQKKLDCRDACESSGGAGYSPEAIDIEEKFPWAIKVDQTDGAGNLSFDITTDEYFGRIPESPTSTTQTNGMLPMWTEDPDNYLDPSLYPCGNPICFDENQSTCAGAPDKDWYWWWWDEWKELVFYAIDDNYTPDTPTYFWVRSVWDEEAETLEDFETRERNKKEETMARIISSVGTTLEEDEWEFVSEITPPQSVPDPHPPEPNLSLNSDSAKFVVIVAGRRLDTQSRETIANKTDLSNYLESENATPNDDIFERSVITSTFNDIACKNESDDCQIP